jgi:hypothetical protein
MCLHLRLVKSFLCIAKKSRKYVTQNMPRFQTIIDMILETNEQSDRNWIRFK